MTGLSKSDFDASVVLQTAFRSALADALEVPIAQIGMPITSTVVLRQYIALVLNLQTTSEYTAADTEITINDRLSNLTSSFVSSAEAGGYTGTLGTIEVIG